MRELSQKELDQVSGGVINWATGAAGALVAGGFAGAQYAIEAGGAGNFSWGEFLWVSSTNAASGFLIGTGAGLVGAAITGAAKGAAVAGVTLIGVGGIIQVTANLDTSEQEKAGS